MKKYTSFLLSFLTLISCSTGTKNNGDENSQDLILDDNYGGNSNINNEDNEIIKDEQFEDKEEKEIIPVHVHTLVRNEIKPTCEKKGYIEETCSDPSCDYHTYEELDSLGHNIVNETSSYNHIKYGDHFNRETWKRICSRCKKEYDTFETGSSNLIYETAFKDLSKGDKELEEEIKSVYKYISDTIEYRFNNDVFEDKEDYANSISFEVKISSKFYNNVVVIHFSELYEEQNPWLGSRAFTPNMGMYYKDSRTLDVSFPLYKGMHTPSARKATLDILKPIYKKCDGYIRKGASEIEKLIACYYTVGHTLSYSRDYSRLFDALRNGNKGNCQTFARLLTLLCNRYGVPCYTQFSASHCFNRVAIDGRWYFVEPQNYNSTRQKYGTQLTDFLCIDYTEFPNRRINTFMPESSERMGNVSDIRNSFFYLYKNNELLGIYHNLDKTLKEFLNDSEADYKVSLGIGSVGKGLPGYLQSNKYQWKVNDNDYKFKSLLFTTDISNIINSRVNNLQISSDLLNKENVSIDKLKYSVI